MSFITFLQIVATTSLVIMATTVIAAIHLIRKQRNSTTIMLKYCSVFFGLLLLLESVLFLPLYIMTGLGVAWVYAGPALDYFLWWIFFGYPIFFIVGQIGAHIAYRRDKQRLSKYFMLLPLLSVIPFALSWVAIGIHSLFK